MDQELKVWYVLINNQKLGPFSVDELLREEPLTPEKFTKDYLVWKEGMVSWLRAVDVPEFAARFNPVKEEEEPPEVSEPVVQDVQESTSAESGPGSFRRAQISKLNSMVEKFKKKFENLRHNNPILVTGTAAAAGLIFICFISAFVYNFVERGREEKILAAEIAQREREFREKRERKEQTFRDSVDRVERERLGKIELELQKKAARDSIAKIQAATGKAEASPPSFTDPRDGNKYNIKRFANGATWFLNDVDNGKGFNWWQAAVACPKGWHLPADKEWRSLASSLKGEAISYFGSKHYWWSAAEGTDSWYLSGSNLVCYSGNANKSAFYRVRCVKD